MGGGGLNAFYLYQVFALDSDVVEVQEIVSSHGRLLTIAMYHGETLIKLTHYDKTKKKAHDSQIVRAKENLKLSHGGPATDKRQAPTHRLKLYARTVIESET